MAMEQRIKTDFHTHILPAVDDGAKDVTTSVGMLNALKEQGVETVLFTPHYYANQETAADFLERRTAALTTLQTAGEIPLKTVLGAEVHLTRDLADTPDIEKLCMGDSGYMLIEMPYLPLAEWMIEVIENIYYRYDCKPLLAHLTRYAAYYNDNDFNTLLSLQDVVVQVNAEDLQHRYLRKLVKGWIKRGVPVVFGSDCHSLGHRRPNFDTVVRVTSKWRRGTCLADTANALAKEMGIM